MSLIVNNDISDTELRDIVKETMKEVDRDKDGRINQEEFAKVKEKHGFSQ